MVVLLTWMKTLKMLQAVPSKILPDWTIFFSNNPEHTVKQTGMRGYRCVSIAHYSLIRLDDYDKKFVEKHGAFWFRIQDLPDLVLDHNKMLEDALTLLRRKARHQPIGFELLPEKFTLHQLQGLYEAIYQRDINSEEFIKKILSIEGLLELVDEKGKKPSGSGSLYQFDYDNYQKLLRSGFNLEI